jgi:hypothetical protein
MICLIDLRSENVMLNEKVLLNKVIEMTSTLQRNAGQMQCRSIKRTKADKAKCTNNITI